MASIDFGATMWGRSWLRVVEPISGTPSPQLPRARRMARDLDVSVGEAPGTISAEVVERGLTLPVEITVPTWTKGAGETAGELLRVHGGGAVGGELSRELFDDLVKRDVSVSVPLDQLEFRCHCRSRAMHCVHVLACIYAAVLAIDERPMIAYELRSSQTMDTGRLDADWVRLEALSSVGFYG